MAERTSCSSGTLRCTCVVVTQDLCDFFSVWRVCACVDASMNFHDIDLKPLFRPIMIVKAPCVYARAPHFWNSQVPWGRSVLFVALWKNQRAMNKESDRCQVLVDHWGLRRPPCLCIGSTPLTNYNPVIGHNLSLNKTALINCGDCYCKGDPAK